MFEFSAPVGQDPPTHVHPTEDEMFYVLDGSFTFQCGENSFEAEPGSFIFLPRGVPHGYTAHDGDRGRLLAITSPNH